MNKFDRDLELLLWGDDYQVSMGGIGDRKSLHLIESPWSMLENPWRIVWEDRISGDQCMINPIGLPTVGDVYAMFQSYDEGSEMVINFAFLLDQYHFLNDRDGNQ